MCLSEFENQSVQKWHHEKKRPEFKKFHFNLLESWAPCNPERHPSRPVHNGATSCYSGKLPLADVDEEAKRRIPRSTQLCPKRQGRNKKVLKAAEPISDSQMARANSGEDLGENSGGNS